MLRAAILLLVLLPFTPAARAATAPDLSERIQVDGFATEYTAGETVFGVNLVLAAPEESADDSKWGANNDIYQIRITWDARNLYLAGEGKIWGNNMIIWLDSVPGLGMTTMSGLNSWSRNFSFDTSGVAQGREFEPDLFGATWDGNTSPRLILHRGGTQVIDNQVGGGLFQASSTFTQDRDGRAMEFAIPWRVVFSNDPEVKDTVVNINGVPDTVAWVPPGRHLKICGAITAGGDNTGGPDSAPDNTRGHTQDGNAAVYIDNFADIALDERGNGVFPGQDASQPDGLPDWGIEPRERLFFKFPPPIVGVRFSLSGLEFSRPAFRPDAGERVRFKFRLDPPVDPSDPLTSIRTVDMTANVYDMRGNWVRNLYLAERRSALDPLDPLKDVWDGRDENGRIVPAGIYIMRVVIEPNLSRLTRSLVVVR